MKHLFIQIFKHFDTFFGRRGNRLLTGNEFTDPFARELSWKPISSMGMPCQSHESKQTSETISFLPCKFSKLNALIYCLLGVGLIAEGLFEHLEIIVNAGAPLFPIIVGACILCYGLISASVSNRRIHINRKNMLCTIDYRFFTKDKSIARIAGIQLVPDRVIMDDFTYNQFEMVLVEKNKERSLLLSHGSKDLLRLDAKKLANFLNVPLWDGTEFVKLD